MFRRKSRPLGEQGEQLAARRLRAQGYKILDRNVRLGAYEVDIIAQDKNTIVFVEVKTRRPDPIAPEANITQKKIQHLSRAAQLYITQNPDPQAYYRFDVVAIVWPEEAKPVVTLFRDAFQSTL